MKIDWDALFGQGIGFIVSRLVLLLLAAWMGSVIAGISLFAGAMSVARPEAVLSSPWLLLSLWLLPNILFFGITACRILFYSESTSLKTWAWLIGMEAFFCMASGCTELWSEKPHFALAWVCFAVMVAMMATGFWFWHGWLMNRFATDLLHLQAENAVRRVELEEEFGPAKGQAKDL